MEEEMFVDNVTITHVGTSIEIMTRNRVKRDAVLLLPTSDFCNKPHYFEVFLLQTIPSDNQKVLVRAKEIGRPDYLFVGDKDFDPRDIIGLKVDLVTNETLIESVHRQSK